MANKIERRVVCIKKQIRPAAEKAAEKKKRVVAYCRVSTDMEIQKSSLELQMNSYNKIIEEYDGWKLAGIYADKGITETKTTNRAEFNRMIADDKAAMDAIYPQFIANTAFGMDLHFPWCLYVGIFAGILVVYSAVNCLLVRKIKRIIPAEVLKNRE